MPRLSLRHGLGIIALLALATVGYVVLRPGFSSASTTAVRAPEPAQSVSSASAPGEWAMEGFNPARTRALDAGIPLPLDRWRELRVTEDKGIGSPIAIARNTILVEAEHYLRALDLRNGRERWSFAETGRYISPAIAGDTVFIRVEANNEGQILALDLATGQQRWAFTPRRLSSSATSFWGGHLTSPVVANGLVFIGAGKELYALDAATGAVRWEYSAQDHIASSATVGDGRVFISDARNLLAIDQQTGALAWKAPATFSIYFSPIVAHQTVFFTNGGNVIALSTTDGAKRWEIGFPDVTLFPAAAQGSRLFVKSTSTLYALDLATGKELWRSDHPNFVSFPAVAGEQLFAVIGTDFLFWIAVIDTVTGQQVWTQPVPLLTTAAPVIAGKTLYVRTTDGRVIGLSN